ncbi:MAG: DUF2726 domain-containing protein [Vallitalea sp.]|jgi:hypothetical protein|nr:DUF2726 domain-containing protein [Vallitalea sp.]
MNLLIIIGLFILLLFIIIAQKNTSTNKNSSSNKSNSKDYYKSYKAVPSILTKAELNFYDTLEPICSELNVILFSKVRLIDLLEITDKDHYQTCLNKVVSKHIDFVICDSKNLKPLICIELDDSSHNQQNRTNRDIFINNVLGNVGYKVMRIKCKSCYETDLLKRQIMKNLNELAA